MRKRNSGGRMANMLRAMNDYETLVRAQHSASEPVETPVDNLIERDCQIAGCEEAGYIRCACCNRTVCWYDIAGADETSPGICSDCAFKCAGEIACQVVSYE